MRPQPVGDEASGPFWAAARAGRLDIQRCQKCHRWNHAPGLSCPRCGSDQLAFEQVSGKGTLYSWCVLREAPGPGFANDLPLTVAIVELVEQPHLLLTSNLTGIDETALKLGMPLEVEFLAVGDDCALPQFRPAREDAA